MLLGDCFFFFAEIARTAANERAPRVERLVDITRTVGGEPAAAAADETGGNRVAMAGEGAGDAELDAASN